MAKMMKRAFRAALRWRLGPNPVKNINTGLLLSTAGSWALLVLGGLPLGLMKPQRRQPVNSRLPNKRPSRPRH